MLARRLAPAFAEWAGGHTRLLSVIVFVLAAAAGLVSSREGIVPFFAQAGPGCPVFNLLMPGIAHGGAADALFRDHAVFRLAFNRFHRVSPRLFRSGQPTPGQLRRWTRRHGLRTVINLRGRHPFATYGQEIAACREIGLAHIDFRLDSRGAPPKDRMLQLLDMAGGLDYPVLAHCKTGADRAGLFAAAFLHGVDGQAIALAQRQLSLRYGHFRQAKTGILDFFFERYVRDAGGQGFRRWLEEEYDPAALKADFMSQWWATILVDRILRRE